MWSRVAYIFRETGASLRRNVTLTVAAVLTSAVSLFLVGGTLLVQRGFENLLAKWAGGVQMIVYVRADVGEDPARLAQVESALKSNATVVDTDKLVYLNHEQSLAEAKRLFVNDPGTYALLETASDFPTQFKVTPRANQLQQLVSLKEAFQGIPGVRGVLLAQDEVEQIAKLKSFVQTVTFALATLLLAGALILIWNTIRTAMFARRREIEVMKLVGATNWFIRIPFMLEGLIQGLVGAVFACVLLHFGNVFWTDGVAAFGSGNGFSQLVVSPGYLHLVMGLILAFGMVAGAIASGFAATRFLDV